MSRLLIRKHHVGRRLLETVNTNIIERGDTKKKTRGGARKISRERRSRKKR